MYIAISENAKVIVLCIKIVLSFSIVCICFPGCFMNTVVSGTHSFPSNEDRENAEYMAYIEAHGAKRKAYSDKSEKRIIVSIWKNQNKLMERAYIFTAASLKWHVTWEKIDDLQIVFFDFNKDSSINTEKAKTLTAKLIFSLRFTYYPAKGIFMEYPFENEIVAEEKNGQSENN